MSHVTSASISIFIFFTWARRRQNHGRPYMIPAQINNGLFQADTVAEKKGSWGPFGDQMLRSLSAPALWFKVLQGQTAHSCMNQYVSGTTAVYKNTCPYIMMSVSVFLVPHNCLSGLWHKGNKLHYNLCLFICIQCELKLIMLHFKWSHSNYSFICTQPLFAYSEDFEMKTFDIPRFPPLLNCRLFFFVPFAPQ